MSDIYFYRPTRAEMTISQIADEFGTTAVLHHLGYAALLAAGMDESPKHGSHAIAYPGDPDALNSLVDLVMQGVAQAVRPGAGGTITLTADAPGAGEELDGDVLTISRAHWHDLFGALDRLRAEIGDPEVHVTSAVIVDQAVQRIRELRAGGSVAPRTEPDRKPRMEAPIVATIPRDEMPNVKHVEDPTIVERFGDALNRLATALGLSRLERTPEHLIDLATDRLRREDVTVSADEDGFAEGYPAPPGLLRGALGGEIILTDPDRYGSFDLGGALANSDFAIALNSVLYNLYYALGWKPGTDGIAVKIGDVDRALGEAMEKIMLDRHGERVTTSSDEAAPWPDAPGRLVVSLPKGLELVIREARS